MIGAGKILSGRYKVVDKIGQGGMQEVFRAHDLIIDKLVAVKTPLQGQASRRFKQSAILASRVNNHGTARTLDYFDEEGFPFLVEEFVEGETLDKSIIEFAGYVDPPFGAILFGILAKGIAASHHVGVVHRDLKPSNILVSGAFSLSAVKITDFGIATLAKEILDQEIEGTSDITKSTSGTVKGAIPFMAPEMMFRKKDLEIGTPADIWSLGCMMFYVLSGRHPYGVGMDAVLAIGNNDRAAWPRFMTMNSQFSPVAEALQGIVERCLSLDPADRPTANELVRMISDICIFSSPRIAGKINSMPNKYFGFIGNHGGGQTMFHRDSVYGPNNAEISRRVVFSRSPGSPHSRAFPVLVQRHK